MRKTILFAAAHLAAVAQAANQQGDAGFAKGGAPAVVVMASTNVAFAADLARRGYVTFSCGALETNSSPADVARQLVDKAAADPRVDAERIGIVGHDALCRAAYAVGLADPRVKAVVASFMGVGRGEEGKNDLEMLVKSDGKPVFFLRGPQDGDREFFRGVARNTSRGGVHRRYYTNSPGKTLNPIGLNEAYVFLDTYVKGGETLKAYQGGRVRLFDRFWNIEGKKCNCVRIPGIAVAPDGSIVVVFDARLWNHGDLCDCQPTRTAVMRSTDCGKTWSEPKFVWNFPWNEKERYSASDPSLIVDRQAGKVFCFANVMEFVRGRNVYRFFVWESTDNGVTWSAPREISEDIRWPGIVLGQHLTFISSGHGIQRSDGALMHVTVAQRFGVNIFGSEDHGRTWKCLGTPTHGSTDESKVEVLADGTWMINSRYSWCRQVHRSTDCGQTWKSVNDMNLPDSRTNAGTVTARLKDGREVLLFCNSSRAVRPRMHITLRASLDGGYSWNKGVLIDPGNCEYSDCAYMPDGRVAVVYEGEGERAIDFVAVPLEEVLKQ